MPLSVRIFSLRHRVQTGSGAHLDNYSIGTGLSPTGLKRPGYKADHSPSSNAEFKNVYSYNVTTTALPLLLKVKVKLPLCFNLEPRHEGVFGEWRYTSTHS
jgi:hypothetical protein